jgi:hypothetical protein
MLAWKLLFFSSFVPFCCLVFTWRSPSYLSFLGGNKVILSDNGLNEFVADIEVFNYYVEND